MNLYNTLKTLCLCPSVSGREDAIRKKILPLISPFCDEVRVDTLGNIIARKKGNGKKIVLTAHMDEIGFIVNYIEDNGIIRVAPVGGISLVASAFSQVVSQNGVKGVIVPESKTRSEDYKPEAFYIDIGAKDKKRAESKISVGDIFVISPSLDKLMGSRVCGRPIDDRIGCAVLLKLAQALADSPLSADVYYVFAVQEEVGHRGALTAAFSIEPDIALCFDVTATGDTPNASPMACKLGGGAAIKIKDSSVICDEEIISALTRIAKEKGIKYQREVLLRGGTDTSAMQLSGFGAAVGALSIPTRFIHSAVEMCDLNDAEDCIALATEFVKSVV